MQHHSIPKGTRDIPPGIFNRRQFIVDTIKCVFQKYGYQQMETPAMENLATLVGKYGDEGEKLLFKILNSGDYLKKIDKRILENTDTKVLTPNIAQKGLRYDLTVPFARYVAMHRHDIVFPFKRFQIQPVWRADRPQKGRYREFYQCDADTIGTRSLFCEAEAIAIISEVCTNLRFTKYRIRVNHKAILSGLAEVAHVKDKVLFFSILDKWHKIGAENAEKELEDTCSDRDAWKNISSVFSQEGSNAEKIAFLYTKLTSANAIEGLKEIEKIIDFLSIFDLPDNVFQLDTTLARGLDYYTGALFEVTLDDAAVGSVCGGGRYDNLTDFFGLPNISGIGFSFGIDRLYDAMNMLDLFPTKTTAPAKVLIAHLDEGGMHRGIAVASEIRKKGCWTMVYPDSDKLKKQMDYAHRNHIPFVIIIGSDEIKSGMFTLKDMNSGSQQRHSLETIISTLHNT